MGGHGRGINPLRVRLVEREGLLVGDLTVCSAPEKKQELWERVVDGHRAKRRVAPRGTTAARRDAGGLYAKMFNLQAEGYAAA